MEETDESLGIPVIGGGMKELSGVGFDEGLYARHACVIKLHDGSFQKIRGEYRDRYWKSQGTFRLWRVITDFSSFLPLKLRCRLK